MYGCAGKESGEKPMAASMAPAEPEPEPKPEPMPESVREAAEVNVGSLLGTPAGYDNDGNALSVQSTEGIARSASGEGVIATDPVMYAEGKALATRPGAATSAAGKAPASLAAGFNSAQGEGRSRLPGTSSPCGRSPCAAT